MSYIDSYMYAVDISAFSQHFRPCSPAPSPLRKWPWMARWMRPNMRSRAPKTWGWVMERCPWAGEKTWENHRVVKTMKDVWKEIMDFILFYWGVVQFQVGSWKFTGYLGCLLPWPIRGVTHLKFVSVFFMRILNLRILHSPWRGGCGSRRARSNLCTNTSSTKSVSADAATCCHLTQTVSWWCNFLLPPYQTSFMPGAACKPVSCWVQLRAASRASVWRRYHCSKTACNLRILQVSNFWVILIIISIMTHTHTLAQKHLIELLMWNASNVHKHFIKTWQEKVDD